MTSGTESVKRTIVIMNPRGFHMRPAAKFAQLANSFSCSVLVWIHDRSVNGKSLWDLVALAANHGTELVIETIGNDAELAATKLAEIASDLGDTDPD